MNLFEEIGNAKSIGISGHERPDGDCVGACMALFLVLKKRLPEAKVEVLLEDVPEHLQKNIPGCEAICKNFKPETKEFDVFVVLDSGKERTSGARPFCEKAGKIINIDHHVSNPGTGHVNLIDAGKSSTCELLYTLLEEKDLDAQVAQALYIGMVTDTGVFRYSNTTPQTMAIAGRLMEYRFDHARIVRDVFYEKSYTEQMAMGVALTTMQRSEDKRIVTCLLDKKTLKTIGATKKDVDGIASQMVLTEGAECAILFYEGGDGLCHGSLRSRQLVNVARIAEQFGGGGHVRAAGCRFPVEKKADLQKTYEEVIRKMSAMAEEDMNNAENGAGAEA